MTRLSKHQYFYGPDHPINTNILKPATKFFYGGPHGYFVQMHNKLPDYMVAIRLPGAIPLSKERWRKLLLRALREKEVPGWDPEIDDVRPYKLFRSSEYYLFRGEKQHLPHLLHRGNVFVTKKGYLAHLRDPWPLDHARQMLPGRLRLLTKNQFDEIYLERESQI
jgi:hypothetical protein